MRFLDFDTFQIHQKTWQSGGGQVSQETSYLQSLWRNSNVTELKFLNLNLSHFNQDVLHHQIEIKYFVKASVLQFAVRITS